jgi:thiol-disulfide isomerase/thioredoxin
MFRRAAVFVALALAAAQLPAQDADTELRAAHAAWDAQWQRYTEAALAARQAGRIQKGAALPDEVQTELDRADALRDALLAAFGSREDLAPGSHLLLARVHERSRDYGLAVRAYEQALERGDPADLPTLHALCLAAMNSKDDQLAARWMRRTVEVEDQGGRRNPALRSSYLPRTLIALGAFDELATLLGRLAEDESPACRAAAVTFGLVLALERGEIAEAQRRVDAIRADQARYPDHQAWAVLAQLALSVGRGAYDEGARAVRAYLDATAGAEAPTSASDRNRRRYLEAVAPFLGRPAPAIRVDHWVGGTVDGEDALGALRGRVVVLDFWQPWCEPCRRAMPELVALQREHPDELRVIGLCKVEDYGYDVSERRAVRGIAAADYIDHVADFRADMDLNYPLAIAGSGVNSQTYAVAGIPTLVVIDRAGIVRYMSCGAGEPGLLDLAVAGVLAGPERSR